MKSLAYVLGCILMLSPLTPALAQPTPLATLLPSPRVQATPRVRVVGEMPLSVTTETFKAIAYGERVSKILGAKVYNDQNQAIGKIEEMVLTPHDSVSIIIVSVGGFLGLGAKNVAISAKEFQFGGNHILLPRATSQVLQQLPPFHFTH